MAKARQQYFADEVTLQKENRDFAIQPELVEKLESIEAGAQVNVIETVKVNGEALVPDEDKAVDIDVPLVEDDLYGTDNDAALSARQGRVLYDYIQNIQSRGRFLSNWNCATGLAMTNPSDNPYLYRTGDYFLVSNVSSGTNYRPNGDQYVIGQASITVESETVKVGDMYIYDGTNWLLLVNTSREIPVDSSLSTTSTNPVENRVITNALNTKQEKLIAGANIQIAVDGKTISATDTTYENKPAAEGGTDVSLVTTGEKYTWNGKQDKLIAGNNISIAADGKTISAVDTTYSNLPAAQGGTDVSLVSTGDKYIWNNKQDAIADLETIRSNASAGKSASDTIATYGDIVTHDASEFATAAQGGLADTAIQPNDNISELTNDVGYITDAYHDSTKQDTLIAGTNIQIASDGKTISATDTTYVAGDFDIKDLADTTGLRTTWSGKQDALTAGANITIDANNEISATDTTYTAGANISISNNNVISATDSKAVWGSISGTLADQTDLGTALGGKQDTLIAGTNVQIASDGKTISATDTTYTAGTGISIDSNNVISNTQTSAEWGNITGTLSDQTDLNTALGGKQDTLVAGSNIQIASDGKTISATDTTYTAGTGISIDSNNVISSTQTSAEWGNITGTLADQTDLKTELDKKMENLVFLSYGVSTWADFEAAYGKNVYCRASSNSNPAQGDQTRCAFMAYINNPNISSATEVEFQYYRSVATHSDSTQGDEVFVYKLNKTTGRSVTKRNAYTKIVAGTNMTSSYNNGTLTLNATDTTYNTATSSTAGLVKLGSDTIQTESAQSASSTAGRTYPVQLNSSDQMVVNVPWEDTTTGSATSTAAGTVKLFSDTQQTEAAQSVSSTANRTYGIQNNSSNQMVVNVPWTDTTYSNGTYLTLNGTTFDVDTSLIATKADLANFAGFQVVATLPTSDIKTNIIYLLGPFTSVTGSDKYEEWIYSNSNWIMIGETSVDLSPYFNYTTQTSDAITEGSTNLFLTSAERTLLGNTSGTNTGDETKATIQSKLGAATSSNDGYLTSADWATFNSKADVADINTKTFYITSSQTSSEQIAIAQDAIDYYVAGNNPIIRYGNSTFLLAKKTNAIYTFWSPRHTFVSQIGTSYSSFEVDKLEISHTNNVASSVTVSSETVKYLAPDGNYTTSFIPSSDGQPATKKYVDDKVSDTAYASSWNGVTDVAPSKNAVYDKISAMDTTISGKVNVGTNVSDALTLFTITDSSSVGEAGFGSSYMYMNTSNGSGAEMAPGSVSAGNGSVNTSIGGGGVSISNPTDMLEASLSINKINYSDDINSISEDYEFTGGGNNQIARLKNIDNTAYGSGWDADTTHAPSKNAVYDKLNAMDTTISGKADAADVQFRYVTLTSLSDTDTLASLAIASSQYTMVSYNSEIYGFEKSTLNLQTGITTTYVSIDTFERVGTSNSTLYKKTIVINMGNTTTATTGTLDISNFLSTSATYSSVYTPTQNYNPATKKYVDDTAFEQMQSAIIKSSSQPERATEGRLWYDMTNKLLKARDGSAWKVVTVDNTAYASSWNGDSTHSPSKDAVYDKISAMDTTIAGKQATLVSGTNIKTINNTSLLGSGNISITAGDMSYSDFGWQAKTGASITLDLASTYTPSANFTVNAPATIKDGQTYILRVNNEGTAYTMTLGTNVTNPFNTDITLTDYGIDQFVFLAIGGKLELQPEGGGGGGAITADTTGTETSISKIWVGTEAEYQALGTYEENVAYMTY